MGDGSNHTEFGFWVRHLDPVKVYAKDRRQEGLGSPEKVGKCLLPVNTTYDGPHKDQCKNEGEVSWLQAP